MSRAPALAAALAALVLALAGCGGDDDGANGDSVATFDVEGFPVHFQYPGGFTLSEDVSFDQSLGGNADDSAAVGLDDDSGIIVQRFTLRIAVDQKNLDLVQEEIDGLIAQVDPGAASQPTTIAGLPALTADALAVSSIEGGESRLTFVFDGDQEYLLNCQSTPETRSEIADACDQALSTLSVD